MDLLNRGTGVQVSPGSRTVREYLGLDLAILVNFSLDQLIGVK